MRFPTVLCCLLGFIGFGFSEAKALEINIRNESGVPNNEVWVMFGGGNAPVGNITYYDAVQKKDVTSALTFSQSYQLSTIRKLDLASVTAGKIFFAFTDTTSGFSSTNGLPLFAPGSGSSSDIGKRWDKIEITLISTSTTPFSSAVNLSAQDFYSIPMELVTYNGSNKAVGYSGWRHRRPSTATVYAGLSSLLSGPAASSVVISATNAEGRAHSVPVKVGKNTVDGLRIISPAAIPSGNPNPYPDPKPYFNSLKTKSKTQVKGLYLGVASGAPLPAASYNEQNYVFTATVSKSGDIILSGSGVAVGGSTPVGSGTITVKADQQRTAFYGLNPTYYVSSYNGGTTAVNNSNSVYDLVISDFFAGMNYGLVNSKVPDPRKNQSHIKKGTLLGNEPTSAWYCSIGTDYYNNPGLTIDQLFGAAQRFNNFYNRYAGYLSRIYDGYAFAYSDKTGHPLVDVTPGFATRLDIVLLPDKVKKRSQFSASSGETGKAIRDNRKVVSYLRVSGQPGSKIAYSDINLNLEIEHPSAGDLTITLTSPAGEELVIQDGGGQDQDLNITETPLPSEDAGNPNGVWTLTATDSQEGNTGTLVDWSLTFP